jgi:hypothetical protein
LLLGVNERLAFPDFNKMVNFSLVIDIDSIIFTQINPFLTQLPLNQPDNIIDLRIIMRPALLDSMPL